MNTNAKNNENKKYLFKEVNNPLFPISNKTPNSLNYYSALKLNINADFKKHKKHHGFGHGLNLTEEQQAKIKASPIPFVFWE